MSPQIVLLVAVVFVVVSLIAMLIRARGERQVDPLQPGEAPAEPGAEGMNVVGDGDIAPGPDSG